MKTLLIVLCWILLLFSQRLEAAESGFIFNLVGVATKRYDQFQLEDTEGHKYQLKGTGEFRPERLDMLSLGFLDFFQIGYDFGGWLLGWEHARYIPSDGYRIESAELVEAANFFSFKENYNGPLAGFYFDIGKSTELGLLLATGSSSYDVVIDDRIKGRFPKGYQAPHSAGQRAEIFFRRHFNADSGVTFGMAEHQTRFEEDWISQGEAKGSQFYLIGDFLF